ncbi:MULTISPECIES: hypothetical protein [unclassified Arthrobacter]|uniref:hypothetical protein n=1 Tax=unclassified Arthrobacter TaxID=235627 RepID=UPI001C84C69F|nr:hypothetical protein [Arthrobacter sp. MAHUQ-56]MBX7445443.1 hypothetical protein [Arthrobacter sp. MAHUQ-56]
MHESDDASPRPVFWVLLTALSVLLLSLVPLIWTPRFYFWDDTENGAYGVWYHLGESLMGGVVPIINPQVWSSGNYAAEGQWGTWNPLIMAIGVIVYLAPDAVLVSTALKIAFLVIGGIGCYLLSRSFRVPPALALVAGVASPLNGFTVFFDSPSWVTGQLAWALLPYFWVLLKLAAEGRRSPLWVFLVGYLIVTIGYVAGTVAVGFVLLSVGIDALVKRRWAEVWRCAASGLTLVMVSVIVYLPGVLTAAVTTRSTTAIANDDYMGVDLSGLMSSTIATAYPMMPSWWWGGFSAPAPALYIAWFLPLVAFLSWRRIRAYAPQIRDILFFAALSLAFVLLPSTVGPLRYPARFMPYLALVCVLLCVVLISHTLAKRPSKLSLLGGTGAITFGMYVGWAQYPDRYMTILVTGLLAIAGICVLWWRMRGGKLPLGGWSVMSFIAVICLGVTFGTTLLQHRTTRGSPLSDSAVPSDTAIPRGVLATVQGEVLVVGDPLDYPQDESTWSRTLMANTWYLSPASVLNRYQLIGHTQYNQALCLRYLGGTCAELLDRLFERRPVTGMVLADELGIDNIQILKRSFAGNQRPTAANNYTGRQDAVPIRQVPEGWHQASDDGDIALWSRDAPVRATGGIVWTSPGTSLTEVARSDSGVTLHVNHVPDGGGRAAFARLPWPGYEARGASISSPVDGFLLAIDVPEGSDGKTLSIAFTPPGWAVGVALWSLGVAGAIILSVGDIIAVRARRTRKVMRPEERSRPGRP